MFNYLTRNIKASDFFSKSQTKLRKPTTFSPSEPSNKSALKLHLTDKIEADEKISLLTLVEFLLQRL